MSTSLRDQLLQAGLVSRQQVKEAERQQQRQTQQAPQRQHSKGDGRNPPPFQPNFKAERDRALNRAQQDKAKSTALLAETKQLIGQHCLPRPDGEDLYHFVDDGKVRHIPVTADIRGGLIRGEIIIVRFDARYYVVPAAAVARIRERDARAVVIGVKQPSAPANDAYGEFEVPDDLIW